MNVRPRHNTLHGQGGVRDSRGASIVEVVVLAFPVTLALVTACGGRQEPVQLVTHEVRPDTVPCAVGPSWELPPLVIGEKPEEADPLRLAWCAEPEGSGGMRLQLMAPQRRPLEVDVPVTAP
jgi:hypothetical protein